MAKVYVITRSEQRNTFDEAYLTVKPTFKEAEAFIRRNFPDAKKNDADKKNVRFDCRGYYLLAGKVDYQVHGCENVYMWIHEEEI